MVGPTVLPKAHTKIMQIMLTSLEEMFKINLQGPFLKSKSLSKLDQAVTVRVLNKVILIAGDTHHVYLCLLT